MTLLGTPRISGIWGALSWMDGGGVMIWVKLDRPDVGLTHLPGFCVCGSRVLLGSRVVLMIR